MITDGKIPTSDAKLLEVIEKINKTLFIIMATVTCLGMCLACGFLAFNIKHRKNRFVYALKFSFVITVIILTRRLGGVKN